MCTLALAFHADRRWPLVVAANRDEFHDRPTAPLDRWRPGTDAAPVLAGRDLLAEFKAALKQYLDANAFGAAVPLLLHRLIRGGPLRFLFVRPSWAKLVSAPKAAAAPSA